MRNDPRAEEILEFMTNYSVLSAAMTERIIGCPHQEGIDYEGEWCPVCEFWKGRDRFTGEHCTEALALRIPRIVTTFSDRSRPPWHGSRILQGERPSDVPAQQPTKPEMTLAK